MTDTKLKLAQKLVKVYEEIDSVQKRGTNSAQNYKYVRAADLAHAVRNALQKLNVYAQAVFSDVRPWTFTTSSGKSQNVFDVTCTLTFIDADDPGGIQYITTGIGSGADFGDKGIFKAQTGALKYALRNAFLVPDETDPENDEHEKGEPEQSTQKKSSPKVQSGATAAAGKPVTAFAGPEKAQIPTDLSGATATPSTTEDATSKSVSSTIPQQESQPTTADANEVPNEEELKPFRKQHMALVKLLSQNGLKSETGNPQNKKVLNYLLKTTGADSAENVTKGQWRNFFQVTAAAAESDVKNLVSLVEGKSTEAA
jgi:hypothetical protein